MIEPVTIDAIRFPLTMNGIRKDTLIVRDLTVVLGACVMAPARDDAMGRDDEDSPSAKLRARALRKAWVTCTVNDDTFAVLDRAKMVHVIGSPGERVMFRAEEDPIILTPREEGVTVRIETRGVESPAAFAQGWEVVLYVV